MNRLFQLFSNELSYAIGWTIIHSLWQCTLIALLVTISYAFTKKSSSATRYWINCAALLICLAASCITFYINYHGTSNSEITNTEYLIDITTGAPQTYIQTLSDIINQHINQIAILWFIGFGVYISKYIAEFFYCQHIKNNHYQTPDLPLQQAFNELKANLGIARNIQLRISNIIDIPCVIGHFKPVVLLPISIVLGLSTKQIDVILLHELGHVRRNDYLISSLQTLIGVLYFFNPFARWISSKIDEERENACDDIAISISGDPLFYANTLKEFAEMNTHYSPAVAMTGRKNLLINRIKRLFINNTSFSKTYGKAIAIMTVFLLTIGYSVTGYSEEKKAPADTFVLKLEDEPLSTFVKLVEDFCPNTKGTIKLKHPDQKVSGNFPDLECNTVGYAIRGLDGSLDATLTGISIDEKAIPLKNLLSKIEGYCPELKGKVNLKYPETVVGFKAENLPCNAMESALIRMDTDKAGTSTTIGKIDKVEFKEAGIYDKAFFKELGFPKEIIDKGYSGDCTATFTVDTNGSAKDIVPACKSPNNEQKQYLENLIKVTAQKTKFPIKMEDGKAVTAKGISVRVKWRKEEKEQKTSSINTTPLPNNVSTIEQADESKLSKKVELPSENADFKPGLSINSEANIASYKEIEFAPLFFGKNLIDTTDAKSYRYAQREFGGFGREFVSATNNSLLKTIKNNKDSVLNPNGTNRLIGEIYIFKIKPYWEGVSVPYTTGATATNTLIAQDSKTFPFRAKVFLGVVLKDAESKEIVAVLKDEFTHDESKTWFNNMSDKQKSRFINEKIVENIRTSINKATSGLIAFSQHRTPLTETENNNHLISFDTQKEAEFSGFGFDSKENIQNYGDIEIASIDFSDTKLNCENTTALKYSKNLFDKENPRYLTALKNEVISQFHKSKIDKNGDLTGKTKLMMEIELTDINLYWEKVSGNTSEFETTSEAIKDPSGLPSFY